MASLIQSRNGRRRTSKTLASGRLRASIVPDAHPVLHRLRLSISTTEDGSTIVRSLLLGEREILDLLIYIEQSPQIESVFKQWKERSSGEE